MWDESKHPRVPRGSGDPSGEFTTSGVAILSLDDAQGKHVVHADGSKPSNDEIAAYFDKNNPKRDLKKQEDYDRVLREMTAELGSQLKQPWSGIDFYSTDVREAMEIAVKEHPSLKGHDERIVFLAMSGIMSNITTPPDQFEASLHFWERYAATGFKSFPMTKASGLSWGVSAKMKNLEALTMLVNSMGMNGAADFLMASHTIDQLREQKISTGLFSGKTSVKGKALEVRSGFAMLGPKVGEYVRNMNGLSGVTIDLWASRTVFRHMGKMADASGKIRDVPTSESQRDLFKSLFSKAGKAHGLTQQEAQAGLWFFEQRLYRKLGKNETGFSLAAGARRYRDRRLLRGGPSRGLEHVSVPPKASRLPTQSFQVTRQPRGARP